MAHRVKNSRSRRINIQETRTVQNNEIAEEAVQNHEVTKQVQAHGDT